MLGQQISYKVLIYLYLICTRRVLNHPSVQHRFLFGFGYACRRLNRDTSIKVQQRRPRLH